jgi:hypothetical protein
VLQDVVVPEVVQRESRRVGLGVRGEGKVEQEAAERLVDVEGVEESVFDDVSAEVLAMVRQEAVVGEGVEHGARRSHWMRRALLSVYSSMPFSVCHHTIIRSRGRPGVEPGDHRADSSRSYNEGLHLFDENETAG